MVWLLLFLYRFQWLISMCLSCAGHAGDCLTVFCVLFRPQQITQLREAMTKTKEELTAKVEETEARAKTAEGA